MAIPSSILALFPAAGKYAAPDIHKISENIINANVPLCYLAIKHRSSAQKLLQDIRNNNKRSDRLPFISEALCFSRFHKAQFSPRQKESTRNFHGINGNQFQPIYSGTQPAGTKKHYIFSRGCKRFRNRLDYRRTDRKALRNSFNVAHKSE